MQRGCEAEEVVVSTRLFRGGTNRSLKRNELYGTAPRVRFQFVRKIVTRTEISL